MLYFFKCFNNVPLSLNGFKSSYTIKSSGHLQILYGNIAPEGAVAKITGKEGEFFEGTAIVFDSETETIEAIQQNKIKK